MAITSLFFDATETKLFTHRILENSKKDQMIVLQEILDINTETFGVFVADGFVSEGLYDNSELERFGAIQSAMLRIISPAVIATALDEMDWENFELIYEFVERIGSIEDYFMVVDHITKMYDVYFESDQAQGLSKDSRQLFTQVRDFYLHAYRQVYLDLLANPNKFETAVIEENTAIV